MRPIAAVILLAALGAACGLPSDVSDEFTVSMSEELLILTVGDTAVFQANVMRGSQDAPGVPIRFTSSAPTIVDVRGDGLVRAISIGIESVRPTVTDTPDGRTVSWGEVVEITGAGLDPGGLNLIFVNETPATIHSFVPAPPDDQTASDTLRIWIPAGVPEQSSILLSRQGGSTAAWPLTVVQADILEPNDFTRRTLEVGSGPLERASSTVGARSAARSRTSAGPTATRSSPSRRTSRSSSPSRRLRSRRYLSRSRSGTPGATSCGPFNARSRSAEISRAPASRSVWSTTTSIPTPTR
jgi:hypothetical protein